MKIRVTKVKELLKTHSLSLALVLFVLLTIVIMADDMVKVFRYWRGLIGPTIYILIPMASVLISILMLIALGEWKDEGFPFSAKILQLIEEGAPVVGLLGTVVALTNGFGNLDLTSSVDASIKEVIRIINESLYSTAFGLSIGLLSWFVKRGVLSEQLTSLKSTARKDPDSKEGKKNVSHTSNTL